jgi:predicted phosphodiesterase
MRRFGVPQAGGFLAALVVAFLLWTDAGAAATPFSKEPYLANAGPTSVTIHYETASPGEGVVLFGTAGAMDRQVPAALVEQCSYFSNPKDKSAPKVAACLYRARLTDLVPGTAYQYQVLPAGKGGPASVPKTFRTFPVKPERIAFIAYGDTRTNPAAHRSVAACFARHEPLFVLHDGDLVASGKALELWGPQFFTPLVDVIDHVPIMPALGNHEGGAENLLRFFDQPGGRTWYSFDCGPVHVTVLDDTQTKPENVQWLDQDLAAAKAPWKIAMYHAPTFNLEGHKSDAARTTFLPVFEKYGVDVVVAGHSHMYERFVPLVRKGPPLGGAAAGAGGAAGAAAPRPITFITAGGGGAPLVSGAAAGPRPAILAQTARAYHYCVFTVDAETLHVEVLSPDGAKIDALTVTKKGGRYDDAYLAQARPMEEAILMQGMMTAATVVESAPAADKPGTVYQKARLRGLGGPATLTVRLADASAGAFAMEPVTVQVAPEKEAAATLSVRALKKAAAEKGEPRGASKPQFVLTAKAFGVEATYEAAAAAKDKSKAKAGQEVEATP